MAVACADEPPLGAAASSDVAGCTGGSGNDTDSAPGSAMAGSPLSPVPAGCAVSAACSCACAAACACGVWIWRGGG
jgi:hypothetical protein